jgi:hypothetical protein
MRANELRAGLFYVANDKPDQYMLEALEVERLWSHHDNRTFIRLHYRWIRHEFVDQYGGARMTCDFPYEDEVFEYHEDVYIIQELLP